MAEMITHRRCRGGNLHPIRPYDGYSIGVDFGCNETAVMVITKHIPPSEGGPITFVVDVQTLPLVPTKS